MKIPMMTMMMKTMILTTTKKMKTRIYGSARYAKDIILTAESVPISRSHVIPAFRMEGVLTALRPLVTGSAPSRKGFACCEASGTLQLHSAWERPTGL